MWKRKEVKRQSRGIFKPHYWRVVLVCLIAALITGEYGATLWAFTAYDATDMQEGVLKTTIYTVQRTNADIIEDLIRIALKEKDAATAPEEPPPIPEDDEGPQVIKKNSRGVLAGLINNITQSGSIALGVVDSFSQMLFQGKTVLGFVALLGALVSFLWWFFIKNLLVVGERRFIMERLVYPDTSIRRVLLTVRVGKIWNTAKVMFMRSFFLALWSLTIVGGFIKGYSYMLVPYILAENPAVGWRDAMRLSKTMMRGNKWRAFVLSLSFLPWQALNICTLGILNVLFVNPYMTAAEAVLYKTLRAEAIGKRIPACEAFVDARLFEPKKADEERLDEAEAMRQYPDGAFPLPDKQRRKWIRTDYRRDYSFWSIVLIFMSFCVAGWLWEVLLGLSAEGFVNRGVLHGPWLPIYGCGGVGVMLVLKKVRDRPLVTFVLSVLLCGALEYGTGWALEALTGTRWWDYSGYFLNLNGYICAEGLLVFGLGCSAAIYFAAPMLDDLFQKIPSGWKQVICVVLLWLFFSDVIYSAFIPNTGKGVTDYDFVVEASHALKGWLYAAKL